MSADAAAIALEAIRIRVIGVFPAQIRAAVEPLSEDQIWWRPNEKSNSIGNLILHLNGSIHLYLNRMHGGVEFRRDRDAEFAERSHIPKAELLKRFDTVFQMAERTFDGFTAERLTAPSPVPEMHRYVLEDLINITAHLSTHAGQIVWIAKMLREGSLDDIWMTSHRSEGAWGAE
jgi:uncharacterized damage-inducible protein DinB